MSNRNAALAQYRARQNEYQNRVMAYRAAAQSAAIRGRIRYVQQTRMIERREHLRPTGERKMALQMVSEEPPRERSRARVSPFDRKLMLATMAETPESFPRPQRGESYTRIVSDRKLMLAMMAETPVSFPEFFTSRGAQKMDFATYNWHELTVHPSDPHVIQRQHPIVAAKPVQSVDQSSVLERFFAGKTKPYVQPLDELERESRYFYQMLGRPELAGKNLPFTIPEGMKVSGLREVSTGLEVTFEPANKPLPSLSEVIRGFPAIFGIPTRQQAVRTPGGLVKYMMGGREPDVAAKNLALFVAPIEAMPEALLRFAGVQWTPEPPATLSGGLVSSGVMSGMASWQQGKPIGVVSPELTKILNEPESWFGAFAGEVAALALFSWAIPKVAKAGKGVWQHVRGVKVTSLVGAEEFEAAIGTGESLEAVRLSRLMLEQERVSPKAASYLREMQRYLDPENVIFGGSKISAEFYEDATRIVSGAAEAVRSSTPYIETVGEAIRTTPSLSRRITNVLGLTKDVSHLAAEEFKFYTAGGESFFEEALGIAKGGRGYVASVTKVTSQESLYPMGEAFSEKLFTGALIEGKIDPQVYLRFIRNVPQAVSEQWLFQMGGMSVSQLKKGILKIPVFTRVVAVGSTPTVSAFTKSVLGIGAWTLPKLRLETPTLTRTIFRPLALESPEVTRMLFQPLALERKTQRQQFMLPNMSGLFQRGRTSMETFASVDVDAVQMQMPRFDTRALTRQLQKSMQVQRQTQVLRTDQRLLKEPSLPVTPLGFPSTPKRSGKRRGRRGGAGSMLGWFEAEYSFPYPEEIMKRFRGG